MTRTGRRGYLTTRDLDGFALAPMPEALPPYVGKPPSPIVFVRELAEEVYATDPEFREEARSVNNKTAHTGNYHSDKTMMAARILQQAEKRDCKPLTSLGPKAIGKIATNWLPKVLAERGLGRQARIAESIRRGRELAAQAATEAHPSE